MKIIVVSFQSITKGGASGTGKLALAIASKLYEMRVGVKLIVSAKGDFSTPFLCEPVHKLSRYYIWIINRFHRLGLVSLHAKRHLEEVLFDRLCQRLIKRDIDLVVSTNCHLPHTLGRCSRYGVRAVLIPGNPADTRIYTMLDGEMRKWRVNKVDPYTFLPRMRAYRCSIPLADHIVCHTSVIFETFKLDFPTQKVSACYGSIIPQEENGTWKAKRALSGTFVVLYVGYTVLLKGLQYLLSAWLNFGRANAELWIVGSIDSTVQLVIDRDFKDITGVKYFGLIRNVMPVYCKSSLVVVPSLLDGGPITALEAMKCGVPVLVTAGCGVKDLIESGKNGFVVNAGNDEDILGIMNYCYDNRDDAERIGAAGLTSVLNESFEDFSSNLTSTVLQRE